MSSTLAIVAGVTLLTVIGIESGGAFLMYTLRKRPGFTSLQLAFFRAGHAHAGVLVILGLTVLLLLDAASVAPAWHVAGVGVLISALLLPAGFFLSVLGKHREQPGPLIALVWSGAGVLAVSLAAAAAGLIATGAAALA